MKRYHIMTDAQLGRLVEQPTAEQRGGRVDIDAELRLPRVHQLTRDIEAVLNTGDASAFDKFKAMRDELQTLYEWFKKREDKKDETPLAERHVVPHVRYLPPPPSLPPLARKRAQKRVADKLKEKYRRVRKRPPALDDSLLDHTPRRTRSKGAPLKWRNLDTARTKNPKLKRL